MEGCTNSECSACIGERRKIRTEAEAKSIINRINRIEGQVRGIKNMIQENRYCDDVLTQIAAVRESLSGVGKLVLEEHLKTCVADRLKSGDETVVEELLSTVERFRR